MAAKTGLPVPRFSDYHWTRWKTFQANPVDTVSVSSLVPGSSAVGYFRSLKGALLLLAEKLLSCGSSDREFHVKWGGDGGPFDDETLTNYCGTNAGFIGVLRIET